MNDREEFRKSCQEEISAMGSDQEFLGLSRRWMDEANKRKYSYHFTWMGLPIIQYPQDIVAMQEIIAADRPDVVVETGVARGGSIIFYASMLELLGKGEVIGVDIDIRPHNRAAIESHRMAHRVTLLQGSSTSPEMIAEIHKRVGGRRATVILDSNHTHEHVLAELRAYAGLTAVGCHLVVMDTVIDDLPEDSFSDRPWSRTNNPKTAIRAFLEETDDYVFETDRNIDYKLGFSVAPEGYLIRVK